MMDANRRNLIVMCFSQFGSNFCYNFVQVFLPFYVLKVSPYSTTASLLWVGAIMGSCSLFSAASATIWGNLSHRFSPKTLYIRAIMGNLLTFVLMGFTTNLYLLLSLRIVQGIAGGSSTMGMIIVTAASPKEKVSSDLGLFQAYMTLGQLLGPVFGSLAVATLGYRGAFLGASILLILDIVFSYLYIVNVPQIPVQGRSFGWAAIDKRLAAGWGLCFTAMIQISFMPSILPNLFEGFHIRQIEAVKLAGVVILLYTSTAMIGTYLWTKVSRTIGRLKTISLLFAFAILFQALLSLSHGIIDFTVLRMLQTGMVAATVPLVISLFASESKGGIIGFLNSARFTGSALGPILATSILAYSNLSVLFLFIAGITLLALIAFRITSK